MAFNLHKVLKALLFSSSQPLSVKDIQGLFARFHDQATRLPGMTEETTEGAQPSGTPEEGSSPAEVAAPVDAGEGVEVSPLAPEDNDAELYQDVPALITATQIREAMQALMAEFSAANDLYLLVEGPNGYRLVTHPRFARWIRILRNEPPPVKLTQSAIETLAIVAYRQPVTRTEIETIRGVSAEAGLNKLLERELVYITGRADLPGRPLQYGTTDKFLEFVGVKSLIELPASDVLSPRQIDEWLKQAVNQKPPTDADMGLPLEDSPAAESAGETVAPVIAEAPLAPAEPSAAPAVEPASEPAPEPAPEAPSAEGERPAGN